MGNDHHNRPSNVSTAENIARWKRAMDGIATTFVETGINPAEGMLIMAKCIGHALQEIPNPSEREHWLENLMRIVRRIMQDSDGSTREAFIWN